MLDTHFLHVSGAAQDLLRRMLQFDPDRRCTVEQALCHAWFDGLPRERAFSLATHEPFLFRFDRENLSISDLKGMVFTLWHEICSSMPLLVHIREDIREFRRTASMAGGVDSRAYSAACRAGGPPYGTYAAPVPSIVPAYVLPPAPQLSASGLIGKARRFLLHRGDESSTEEPSEATRIILPTPALDGQNGRRRPSGTGTNYKSE